jgi:membrane protease YdiL (CAAX protease family)
LFALLYGLTGSLWAPMVVHALMDITSGRIAYAASASGQRSPAWGRSALSGSAAGLT